jgi:murein DD-endopeptidase MepM/ murein hydrolase activator NlpD
MKRRITLVVLTVASLLSTVVVVAGTPAAAASPRIAVVGTVKTGGTALNMRRTASAAGTLVGTVANGGRVSIVCQVVGQHVNGTVRATRVWDRLSNNSYVSDGYVVRRLATRIPVCATSAPVVRAPASVGAWMLPVAARIISNYRTTERPTHDGVDLAAIRNTPIHAVAAGTVIRVVCNVSTNNCDVDGNRTLSGCGWYAEIQHAEGFVTRYCHMIRRPSVAVGQVVTKGQIIGYVGTSGSSSGPHLHFEVHSGAPATRANALHPVPFMRARGLLFG